MKKCTGLIVAILMLFSVFTGCTAANSSQQSLLPSLANLVSAVEPSVVAITTESVTYDDFNQPHTSGAAGSGWVIDEKGTIVTNNHVIEGATKIWVDFASNDQVLLADAVQADPSTDIAVVKVSGRKLTAARVGDSSKMRVGDWVMTIGNPLGIGISAKQGIVSRLGVSMSSSPEQQYADLIETSAAINPGNSGGPLVNMSGEVMVLPVLKLARPVLRGWAMP